MEIYGGSVNTHFQGKKIPKEKNNVRTYKW